MQKYTKYKISYAKDGERIEKGRIYLAPNNKHLKVSDGLFVLNDDAKYNYAKPSVSLSYESFSSYYKDALVVIQECGYASDGVDKLKLLKENGSKLIIQDQSECEAKPMVNNALAIGVENYIFKLKDMIGYINFLDTRLNYKDWVTYLIDMIYIRYSYDFRLYNRGMVNRRLDVFMLKHDVKSMKDVVGLILFNSSAFKSFFLEISINVTELFREAKSLNNVVDFLNKNYKKTHNIKLWSAGCSSGEEVYSLAILLDDLDLLKKSIIYATDFNSVILQEAKNGLYSKESYELAKENFKKIDLDEKLDDYVEIYENFVAIDERIKKKTLFFHHNLATDSSFNEFDIIVCRNVIIYFDDDLQKKVFQLFYDSLKFGGHLVLGESEHIHPSFSKKLQRDSANYKIFKKVT